MSFEVGDRVTVKAGYEYGASPEFYAEPGQIYTVSSGGTTVRFLERPGIDGRPGFAYNSHRFELVQRTETKMEFKIGDRVKCIGMDPTYTYQLVTGVVYTIGGHGHSGWVSVQNDPNGYDVPGAVYAPELFELVERAAIIAMVEPVAEKRKKIKWNKDLVQIEATKFKKRSEFSRYAYNAYHAARSLGILDEVCAHMPERSLTKKFADSTKKVFIKYENRSFYYTIESKYVNLERLICPMQITEICRDTIGCPTMGKKFVGIVETYKDQIIKILHVEEKSTLELEKI